MSTEDALDDGEGRGREEDWGAGKTRRWQIDGYQMGVGVGDWVKASKRLRSKKNNNDDDVGTPHLTSTNYLLDILVVNESQFLGVSGTSYLK